MSEQRIRVNPELYERGLSFGAIGMYLYMLTTPEDRAIRIKDLMASGGVCREKVEGLLDELFAANLAARGPGLPAEDAREILCRKRPQGFDYYGDLEKHCSWCFGTTLILQSHHYPIPKAAGGTSTVQICANCHAEYHFLTREGVRPLEFQP